MVGLKLIVVLCLLRATVAENLIGYDCTHPRTNTTPISLSVVQECSEEVSSSKTDEIFIQILQAKRYETIEVRSCLVTHSYVIMKCGRNWANYAVKYGFGTDEVIPVTKSECDRMHNEGLWRTPWGQMLSGFKGNSTTTYHVHDAGDNDVNGYCNTGESIKSYKINGILYEGVIVPATYKITLRNVWQLWDRKSHDLMLGSGQRFKVMLGEGFDMMLGSTFWNLPEARDDTQCTASTHMLIYEGPAYKISAPNNQPLLVVNRTNKALAIDIVQAQVLCGYDGYTTNHPRILVLESRINRPLRTGYAAISPEEIDADLHTNAKLGFILNYMNGEFDSLYTYIRGQNCLNRHQMMHHLTSIAILSPDDFAWAYAKKPGVTAILSGEAVYILNCVPLVVAYRQSTRCYQEIPVTYANTSMFIKPRSRILVKYGTEVPCNPIAPPLFVMDGRWFQLHPQPHEVPSPIILKSDPDQTWQSRRPVNLMGSGLYSAEDMEKYQKRLLFPLEQPAIQQVLTYRAGGLDVDTQKINFMTIMDESTLETYTNNFMKKMFGYLWDISLYFAAISGFFVMLSLIKYIINLLVSGTLLYKIYGFSVKLLYAIGGTIALNMFHLISRPARKPLNLN